MRRSRTIHNLDMNAENVPGPLEKRERRTNTSDGVALLALRGLIALFFVTGVSVIRAQNPEPIQPRSWYLTNNFACFFDGTVTNCGPHLAMDPGNGNGTFPSGFVQVSDGASRIWIAPEISPRDIDYSTSVWTLNIAGTATVTRFNWTVGLWDWSTATFTPAAGPETTVNAKGRSTFAPTGPFTVPGRRLLAFRAIGTSGDGTPSFFDVYDELGGNSPTSLTVAGQPSDEAPPEVVINAADKIACDSSGATLQSSCGRKWAARYDGTLLGADWGADVVASPDGSRVFVTGSSDGVPPRQTDFVTIAYDATTGALIWTSRVDDPLHSDDQAVAAAISPDGKHLYVTGSACVAKGALFCTNLDYLTVSYNAATGAEEWRAGYGGPAGGNDSPKRLVVSNDGTVVVVTGESWSGAANDYATIAYDAGNGTQRWVARYDGTGQQNDTAQALQISPDGATAYVTGTSKGVTSGSDFATVAYDIATGATCWTARFDGSAQSDDFAVALALSPNGKVLYVTGSTASNASGRDYAIIAYSALTGDALWTQLHNGQWNGDDWPAAIAVNPDGTRVFVTGREDENALASEAATIAFSASTGAELWLSRYSAGKHQNQPQGLAPTPDGNGLVVAITSLSAFPYSSADYVTILYGATFGEARWSGRYDGPAKDDDESAAVTLSADGATAFVTGISAGYRAATGSDWDCATVAYSLPPAPTVVSRKTHGNGGAFDIALPLSGTAGVECRSGGPERDYELVFTFDTPLTSVDGASISTGTARVSSNHIDGTDAHRYVVNLTEVANAQRLTLNLLGISDGLNNGDLSVPITVLGGDTNGDGFVNSADIAQTKSRSGQLVDDFNFRSDLNADGNLNSADIALVKSNSGSALP